MENLNQCQKLPSNLAQLTAQNRQILQKFQVFGKQLYTIIAVNPDPKWKEETMQGVNTFRNEVKAYIIKAIDIYNVGILEKDLDQRPKVIINNGLEGIEPILFELAEPDFKPATRANVIECIERIGKPGSKPMFFSVEDLPTLDKLVEESNIAVVGMYEDFTRKCMSLAKTVRGYCDQNKRIYQDYLRQCGINNGETEINIHMEARTVE